MLTVKNSKNSTPWSNTLKQFVGNLPTNCLSVFDHIHSANHICLKASKEPCYCCRFFFRFGSVNKFKFLSLISNDNSITNKNKTEADVLTLAFLKQM